MDEILDVFGRQNCQDMMMDVDQERYGETEYDDFWLRYLGRLWCHLLRWIDENRLWQQVILGANEGGLKFTFWCTRFEMFIRYPNGNVKQAGGYTYRQIYKSQFYIYIYKLL